MVTNHIIHQRVTFRKKDRERGLGITYVLYHFGLLQTENLVIKHEGERCAYYLYLWFHERGSGGGGGI